MGYYPFDTIKNVAISAFDDGAPVPVKQLELAITPVQTGTGDPAPDNVRPIYGFTEADIFVNGVNQWDEDWEVGIFSPTTGEPAVNATQIRSKNFIPIKGGEKYFSKITVNTVRTVILFYDLEKNYLGISTLANVRNEIFTAPDNAFYMRLYTQNLNNGVYNNFISINYPAIETAYHKFNGEVYEVEFPEAAGTVYGGTLKYMGGGKYLLTVDKAGRDIGGILSMTYNSGGGYFVIPKAEIAPNAKTGTSNVYLCSIFRQAPSTSDNYFIYETSNQIRIVDTDYNDADAFRTAMSGEYLVYPLATAQTYEITAEAVETLYKNNVIFANTGNIIKLEYRLNQLDYYRRLEMYNFGYIMLNGGGIDLSSSDPQSITGAWARTATAIKTGKPIFAYNTKYGSGKNLTPVPCFAWYINSTTAVIVGATLHIQVTSDDTCVVQDVAPSVNRAFTMAIDELAGKAVDVDELKTAKVKAKK